MDDVKQMFRKLINGQSLMKSEVLGEIRKVDKKVEDLREETRNGFKEVNKRIDKIGMQTASVEDDTPTIEEFDKLEKRVTKVEQKVASI